MSHKDIVSYVITAPYSEKGGVTSFVNSTLPFFKNKCNVFYRGSVFKGGFKVLNWVLLIWLPFKFAFFILKNSPSCIIVNTSLSLGSIIRDGLLVFISKLFGFKVLLIVHGFRETDLKYRKLLKWGYFKANSIMVLSDVFSEKLLASGYKGAITRFYNPVAIDLLNFFATKQGEVEKNSFVNFLFLARVEKSKGIYACIDAFNIALNKHPNITLTVAGDGTELKNVKEYASSKKIPNIAFTGFVVGDDKKKLFETSDVLIFPTDGEGLPINVLESMAAGLVILTRPVGGLIDLYKSIEFGILTESTKAEDFATLIGDIIESKEHYNSIKKNNQIFAQQNFNPTKIVAEIENNISLHINE